MWRRACLVAAAVVFCLADGGASVYAADSDDLRPYVSLRVGPSFYTGSNFGQLTLRTPSSEAGIGGAVGLNLDRHWGVELSLQSMETNLDDPTGEKVGEYSIWTLLAQARWRYPVWEDRLSPYLVAGLGAAYGEFNDRSVLSTFAAVDNRADTSFVAAFGAGVDYFIARNIAIGAEAKYHFLGSNKVVINGRDSVIDLDSVAVTVHLRAFLDELVDGPQGAKGATVKPVKDSDETRGYLALRGGTGFFTKPDSSGGLSLKNPGKYGGTTAVGLNIDKYLGAELSGGYTTTDVDLEGLGKVSEYTLWTVVGQLRLRYPVLNDKLSPYVVAGGGVGFGEVNDKRITSQISGFDGTRDTSWIGSVGAGFDYFLAENIALNLEVEQIYGFTNSVTLRGRPVDLDLDPLFVSLGIRLFFP